MDATFFNLIYFVLIKCVKTLNSVNVLKHISTSVIIIIYSVVQSFSYCLFKKCFVNEKMILI